MACWIWFFSFSFSFLAKRLNFRLKKNLNACKKMHCFFWSTRIHWWKIQKKNKTKVIILIFGSNRISVSRMKKKPIQKIRFSVCRHTKSKQTINKTKKISKSKYITYFLGILIKLIFHSLSLSLSPSHLDDTGAIKKSNSK